MMPKATSSKRNRILVALFFIVAILLAVWGSVEFKRMIDDDKLQEKLDEVRPSARRS